MHCIFWAQPNFVWLGLSEAVYLPNPLGRSLSLAKSVRAENLAYGETKEIER
jgi:hypothetical protein